MSSSTAYLDAVLTVLDAEPRGIVDTLLSDPTHKALIDLLIRLAADAPAGPTVEPNSPDFVARFSADWTEKRGAVQSEVRRLHAKRKRSASPPPTPAKRTKLLPATPAPISPDIDDEPVFTLHALSVSSPVRKKLDIALHQRSIRLGESCFSLTALKRAFILPTRGKTKPHWTVVLMSSDQAVKPVKGAAAPIEGFQIVFGVDAEPTTTFSSTAYPAEKQVHAKGSPTRATLLEFLRQLPCPLFEPSADVFAPAGGGGLGIAGYRGAKEGTIWFLSAGVLCENKPCEFWALQDIDDADDAVRLQSATGRTCTVLLRRRTTVEAGEEFEGEETDFGMIEGREQDDIRQWVRRYRPAFGKEVSASTVPGPSAKASQPDANSVADVTLGDDESDSDFAVDSDEDDGGSPTSNSDSDEDENAAGSGDKGTDPGSAVSDSENQSGDEEDDGPLDPSRHPLMRPGALPKMSKAVMDMAVGVAVDDLIGGGQIDQDGEEDELDE